MQKDFLKLIDVRKAQGLDPVFTIGNDFVIGLQIGQGAFANVVRAQHKTTGHSVALKTYEKKLLTHKS